jgi:hypothetical protein
MVADINPGASDNAARGWWTRLTRWLTQDVPMGPPAELFAPQSERRALEFLKAHLSREQLKQFDREGTFDVVGGETGKVYRIGRGKQMNVHILGKRGEWIASLCFMPKGYLPMGDLLLAQKIALELYEDDVLRVANRAAPPHHRARRG